MPNFNTTKEDHILIDKIANRVSEKYPEISLLEISMDITATHCNGCRLDLGRLLAAEDFDFFHDVGMIRRNLNRSTGKLENRSEERRVG